MKRIKQFSILIIALAGLISTTSAWAGSKPPQVSNNKLAVALTEKNSIIVRWEMATDDDTPKEDISYFVYVRSSPSNSYVPQYHVSGRLKNTASFVSKKYRDDYTSYDLKPGTTYYVYVRAYDKNDANYLEYQSGVIKTKADTENPTPGSYEAGYPKAGYSKAIGPKTIGPKTIKVKWTRASDNVTEQANLRYQVSWKKKSGVDWKYSHSKPFTNYPKDWTEYTITGLEANTEYVVDVIVYDEAGNYRWYGERTVRTRGYSVIVKLVAVTGVTVSPASLNVEVGATGTLTASVAPDNASVKTVTWSSSDAAVATVDGSGTVKGIAPGTATITVKTSDGGKTATATVTVKEATAPTVKVTSVTLNRSSATINGDYEEIRLTATVAPATATDKSLTWTSDNPKVASVDATGLVTIHKKGKATITVTANDGSGQSASCNFDVITTVGNETVDGLRVYAAAGQLHLTLPTAQTVHIYNVNGAMVKTLALPAGDYVQPLAPGVYVVRVGERVTKVMVK